MCDSNSNPNPVVEYLLIKWGGKEYKIGDLTNAETVLDLKLGIQRETGVLAHRQKLLGLKVKGKPAPDDAQLGSLNIKSGTKILMIGSLEEDIKEMITQPEAHPEIIDDFDMDEEEIQTENREEFLAKIDKRIKDYKINILNEIRFGKKLLVLDIDYTLFDHCSTAHNARELMRPYLHEFLTSAYDDYDIVIWSATGMKWIEVKMRELGVTSNPNFKIAFYLDSTAMINVHTPKYGLVEVKPLGVIWGKYENYSSKNTIMFDDLRRNFLMNPQNGLKIRPYKKAHLNRDSDQELIKLAKYLKSIATLADFSHLNHRHWERGAWIVRNPNKKLNKYGFSVL